MGNPIRGEVSFEYGDETFTLLMDFNALCSIEGETGLKLAEVIAMMTTGRGSATFLRTCFWSGLRQNHAAVSLSDAGRMISTLGVDTAEGLVIESIGLAFPKKEDANAPADPHRPAKRTRRGTGPASTPLGAS